MNVLILDFLLKIHASAEQTPYFHLGQGENAYARRNWILGARSPELNDNNPAWLVPGFVQPKSTRFYRELCSRLAIRAHTTFRSDRDRHQHNHRSWSISIILAGGYWEILEPTPAAMTSPLLYKAALDTLEQDWISPLEAAHHKYLNALGIFWRAPGDIVFRRATDYHKLILPRGVVCKSIFIFGRKSNDWGFRVDGRHVPWREYLANAESTKRMG